MSASDAGAALSLDAALSPSRRKSLDPQVDAGGKPRKKNAFVCDDPYVAEEGGAGPLRIRAQKRYAQKVRNMA